MDMLHLDVWWRGCNVLVDGGSYLYNGPGVWHNHFQSANSHNTVVVDSRDPGATALATAFAREFPRDSTHRLEEWTSKPTADLANLVGRVKKSAPQALLYAGDVAEFTKVRAALRGVDPQLPLLFGGHFEMLGVAVKR